MSTRDRHNKYTRLRLTYLFCAIFFAAPPIIAAGQRSEPPEQHGMQAGLLADMTNYIVRQRAPVFSLLISRRGHLVYELYTHNLTRNHNHYLMSVTKSVTATLVGLAIDKALIKSVDQSITEILPIEYFASPAERKRFRNITVKHVLSMSALDALVPPHAMTAEAEKRNSDFHAATNRAKFALTQNLLKNPGEDFQYQDITPSIAIGLITAASNRTSWDFAKEYLFDPMGFANAEWMHRDDDGLDLGAYGLRLRPIDMQKFGILYLDKGVFDGKRLLSKEWIAQVNQPILKSDPSTPAANYSYYFWHPYFYNDPKALMASGWRGQFIAVVPEKDLVVTMTGCFLDGKENEFFITLMNSYVFPSVSPSAQRKGGSAALKAALAQALSSTPVDLKAIEERMVPQLPPPDPTGR